MGDNILWSLCRNIFCSTLSFSSWYVPSELERVLILTGLKSWSADLKRLRIVISWLSTVLFVWNYENLISWWAKRLPSAGLGITPQHCDQLKNCDQLGISEAIMQELIVPISWYQSSNQLWKWSLITAHTGQLLPVRLALLRPPPLASVHCAYRLFPPALHLVCPREEKNQTW